LTRRNLDAKCAISKLPLICAASTTMTTECGPNLRPPIKALSISTFEVRTFPKNPEYWEGLSRESATFDAELVGGYTFDRALRTELPGCNLPAPSNFKFLPSSFPIPFPLQNIKENAPERRTFAAIPLEDHCHPVERGGVYWKWRNMSRLHNKNDVIDFDFVWVFFAARPVPNWPNARRKADILSNHGLDSWRTISPLRQPLPGQLSDS
jgi:hypothetical protein